MMEIPAGKWCGSECPLCQYDKDACVFYCNHVGFDKDKLEDEISAKHSNWASLRCVGCLSAYPYGGTIEIKAKEKP